MEKYDKLFKGLEMCAGPECCKDGCPYYGETRGGKTCRAWLLNDAAMALALEMKTDRPAVCSDTVEMVKNAAELRAAVEYWRGQADALKWCLHNYFDGSLVEARPGVIEDMELPEAEADANV